MSNPNVTPAQVDAVLIEIGSFAEKAAILCNEAVNCASTSMENLTRSTELMQATAALISQVGWMADHCTDPLSTAKGDATQWLLPPSYHRPDNPEEELQEEQ